MAQRIRSGLTPLETLTRADHSGNVLSLSADTEANDILRRERIRHETWIRKAGSDKVRFKLSRELLEECGLKPGDKVETAYDEDDLTELLVMKPEYWAGYTLREQGLGAGFTGTVGPELTEALFGEGEPERFHTYARVIVSEGVKCIALKCPQLRPFLEELFRNYQGTGDDFRPDGADFEAGKECEAIPDVPAVSEVAESK